MRTSGRASKRYRILMSHLDWGFPFYCMDSHPLWGPLSCCCRWDSLCRVKHQSTTQLVQPQALRVWGERFKERYLYMKLPKRLYWSYKLGHSTWFSHRCFVDNHNIFKGPSHSSLCDIVGAKCVDEAGVHPKVIFLRKLHEWNVEIFMKHQLVTSHFEVGCFHFWPQPNKPYILRTKKEEFLYLFQWYKRQFNNNKEWMQ